MRRRQKQNDGVSGVFLIDKPVGPTSREVVDSVTSRLGIRGAGHCGTLDPLASGLLVVVCGSASRVQNLLTVHDKTYESRFRLGATSLTLDREGPIVPCTDAREPTRRQVDDAVGRLIGPLEQVAPERSAIRVAGQRLHERARRGESVEAPVRRVHVHSFAVVHYGYPDLDVVVHCGPGTYIRALARDIGVDLGIGSYVDSLRRIACGSLTIAEARSPDATTLDDIRSLETVLAGYSRVDVDAGRLSRFLNGVALAFPGLDVGDTGPLVAWHEGRVLALCRRRSGGLVGMERLLGLRP